MQWYSETENAVKYTNNINILQYILKYTVV